MSQTIFLKIGEKDRVPLGAFIASLQSFLGILRDVDSTISKDQRGSVIWEVVSLQQNSPPIIGVSPTPRGDIQDFSQVVEAQVLENIDRLSSGQEPTVFMSFSALTRLEKLATKTKTLGEVSVFTEQNGLPARRSVIAEPTLNNVRQLTGVRYSGYGTISGKLEAISVHNANEFRVWDEKSLKPVRCKFELNQEEKIKGLLRQSVIVAGEISSNVAGIPISMAVEDVEPVRVRTLPTIEEMSGFVKDFTDGKTLKKYMEDISDE